MAVDPFAVDVLMSTCNGAPYVAQQLDSILQQDPCPRHVLVRDDGSTDGTVPLLERYAASYPGQVVLADAGGKNLGPRGSFAALLERCDADYALFSDQDDVWLPGKLGKLLGRMRQAEARYGRPFPLLVHSDLTVVDRALRPLGRSYWAYHHLDPVRGGTLNRLLIQNVVTGCATLINRALAQRAAPIPAEAAMHDWWLALAAAAFGRIECLPEPTVLYRQHGGNQIGATRWCAAHVFRKALRFYDRRLLVEGLTTTQTQARAFLERYGPLLTARQRAAVTAYAGLGRCGFFGRRWRVVAHGFYRAGWMRNLALLAQI